MNRILNWFRLRRLEGDFDRELQYHIDRRMSAGRTVFAQLMDGIPTHEFRRCVARYRGRSFSCWDQFLSMAFAQPTFRESLRDIETCLRAHSCASSGPRPAALVRHGISRFPRGVSVRAQGL